MIEEALCKGLFSFYDTFITLAWPTGGQHPAVICFFVLGGFCVHAPFEARMSQAGFKVNWADYLTRRARRIMPVYWAGALIGMLLVGAMRWRPVHDYLLELHCLTTLDGVLARFGAYTGLMPKEVFAGNITLGTVGVEILIYLAYPIFYHGAKAERWILLGTVALAMQLATILLLPYVDPFVLFSSVLPMALFWYIGALAAHLRRKYDWVVKGAWLGATWAAFLLLKMLPHFYGLNMIKQAVWGFLCMLLIIWLISWEERNARLRDTFLARRLRWNGDISYPLYAVHTPMILLVNWALLSWSLPRSYPLQLFLTFAASIAASVLVHKYVEKRFYQPRQGSA